MCLRKYGNIALGTIHEVRQHFLGGGGGCQMLTFDDSREMRVLKTFENPPLFFLESLVFQNLGHKQNMITVFEVAPF